MHNYDQDSIFFSQTSIYRFSFVKASHSNLRIWSDPSYQSRIHIITAVQHHINSSSHFILSSFIFFLKTKIFQQDTVAQWLSPISGLECWGSESHLRQECLDSQVSSTLWMQFWKCYSVNLRPPVQLSIYLGLVDTTIKIWKKNSFKHSWICVVLSSSLIIVFKKIWFNGLVYPGLMIICFALSSASMYKVNSCQYLRVGEIDGWHDSVWRDLETIITPAWAFLSVWLSVVSYHQH